MAKVIAIAGATGNVGREMLKTLEQRNFPVSRVHALASPNSVGQSIPFKDHTISVENLWDFDFSGVDIVLASAGGKVSAEFAPKAAGQGSVVIDNSSHFRMDLDIPLIVPEVNPKALAGYKARNIIANPNCSTIQMVVALKPLHDAFGIDRIVVSTYQSTSGAGKAAMEELKEQSATGAERKIFPKDIAFNVIPQIDVFMENGQTKEEWKMEAETRKILDPEIRIHANCARVPSFVGHAEYVNIELKTPATLQQVKEALAGAKGVTYSDQDYHTPKEIAGLDDVYVSRLRKDNSLENGYSFWCVSDNLRKGAALNAVQIAEALIALA